MASRTIFDLGAGSAGMGQFVRGFDMAAGPELTPEEREMRQLLEDTKRDLAKVFGIPQALLADPATRDMVQEMAERILDLRPSATTLKLGHPLCIGTLAFPTRYDYCTRCQIDLTSNPDALVTSFGSDEDITVRCDCGLETLIPKWLFR